MSKSALKILWIDDNQNIKGDADILGSQFIHYSGKYAFFGELDNKISKSKPHLVIIDHKLDEISTSLPKRGYSIADYVREKSQDSPIIGYSADPIFSEDPTFTLQRVMGSVYDDIFPLKYIRKNRDKIRKLAKDFNILRKKIINIRNFDKIMELIKAPETDSELLVKSLPDSVLECINRKESIDPLILAKWIRKILMGIPGFLYDSLDAATHVGLQEKAFLHKDIQTQFKKGLYTGLFSKSSPNKLWWTSTLRKIVFKKSKSEESVSWKAGHYIKGVKETDYSRCFKCNRLYPEIVGFTELSRDTRAPLHLACSEPHPYKKSYLLFDEPRIRIEE